MTKKKALLGAGMLLCGIIIAAIIYFLSGSQSYYSKEITLEDLPESIRQEAEASLETGGAYFYRSGDDENLSYVLLTFGVQKDLAMKVECSDIEDGLYFSVTPVETANEEQVVYKVYETNATTISSDKNVLQNPRLVQGSQGINVGYLQKSDAGYYILPLEDDTTNDRVFKYDGDIADGLYRYTYTLSKDGPVITNVSAIDQYSKKGYVSNIDTDSCVVDVYLVGEQEIKFPLHFDPANAELLHTLSTAKEYGAGMMLNFTIHHEEGKGLYIDSVKVMTMPFQTEQN